MLKSDDNYGLQDLIALDLPALAPYISFSMPGYVFASICFWFLE